MCFWYSSDKMERFKTMWVCSASQARPVCAHASGSSDACVPTGRVQDGGWWARVLRAAFPETLITGERLRTANTSGTDLPQPWVKSIIYCSNVARVFGRSAGLRTVKSWMTRRSYYSDWRRLSLRRPLHTRARVPHLFWWAVIHL